MVLSSSSSTPPSISSSSLAAQFNHRRPHCPAHRSPRRASGVSPSSPSQPLTPRRRVDRINMLLTGSTFSSTARRAPHDGMFNQIPVRSAAAPTGT
jgi:hypothetical protein